MPMPTSTRSPIGSLSPHTLINGPSKTWLYKSDTCVPCRRQHGLRSISSPSCCLHLDEDEEALARLGFLFTRTTGRCTMDYWGSMVESWLRIVSQTLTVSKVFESRAYERYRSNLTLMEAMARSDNECKVYARKGFPYLAWEVKTRLIYGLVSEMAAACQARPFYQANEACDLHLAWSLALLVGF